MMKRKLMAAGLLGVFLLGLGGVGPVFAQTPEPPPDASELVGVGDEKPQIREIVFELLADQLSLTVEELHQKRDDGETLRQIAQAKGMDAAEFETLMRDTRSQAVEQALAEGIITQEQADKFNENSADRTERRDARLQTLAEGLSMDGAELQERLYNGENLKDIAAEKGLDDEQFRQLMQNTRIQMIDLAVVNGTLTQERADKMKEKINYAPTLLATTRDGIAEGLGMTPDELKSSLDSGKKLKDIASEQGLSKDQFKTLIQDARSQAIDQAVSDGVVTQEQGDKIREKMEQGSRFRPIRKFLHLFRKNK
jgi:uncharacterized protein YidB (DUF937 family)